MSVLGASRVLSEVNAAATSQRFVFMGKLLARASAAIARATGAEAGFVTACCAAGITLAVAAAMTGPNRALIERLHDTAGLKDEVVIQSGHRIDYGARVDQALRLTGTRVVAAGAKGGPAPGVRSSVRNWRTR